MPEDKNKKMLQEEELDQVSGGNMFESFDDWRDADKFKQYHVTIKTAPWLKGNTYTYNGKDYNRKDLFAQLLKDGARKVVDVPTYGHCGDEVKPHKSEEWV